MSLSTSRSGGWNRLTLRMVKMNWALMAAEGTGGSITGIQSRARSPTGGEHGAVQRDPGRPRRRRPHHGVADLAGRLRRPGGPRPAAALATATTGRGRPVDDGSRAGEARQRRVPGRSRRPRSCPARTSRPPAGSSPRTGPGRSICSASPASCIFNTFHNGRFAALERSDPDLVVRRRPGPQPGNDRLLLGRSAPAADLLRAAGRLRPVRGGRPSRRWTRVRPRCWCRRPARRATRPATSGSTRCGRPPRRPASRWCSTSAAGESCSTRRTSTTACPSRRTSTAARRTSARSTTWPSPGRRCRRSPRMIFDGVLERFPHLQDRRDRAGRDLDAELDAPDGVGVRRLRPARGAPAGALTLRPTEYVQRQIRATPYPTEDVGWITEQVGPDICLFSSDYPARRGWPQADRALRGARWATRPSTSASASTATTSST